MFYGYCWWKKSGLTTWEVKKKKLYIKWDRLPTSTGDRRISSINCMSILVIFYDPYFFDELNQPKATSWESSADYMASWRPAVDLEAAASAADEDKLTWRSQQKNFRLLGCFFGLKVLENSREWNWKKGEQNENVGYKLNEFRVYGKCQTMIAVGPWPKMTSQHP